MIFSYEAFTRNGEKVLGTIEAENQDDVERQMHGQDLIISRIKPIRAFGRLKVTDEELIVFTRLLATAVNASVPLTRALEITMEELSPKSNLRTIVLSVLHQLKVGKALSESLHMYQHVFSELYVSMVRAGERSGKLGKSLDEVLNYLQKRYELKKKISSALLYPSMIISFALIILVFFIIVLIPRFQESYAQFGSDIPKMTKNLMAFTDWLKGNSIFIFLGIGVILMILRAVIRTPKGRRGYESFLFNIPVVGEMYKKDIISRLTRTLSVLLNNGITLVESLELSIGVLNNSIFRGTIRNAIQDLTQGKTFTGALKENKYIPSILIQMTAMGEESGRLAQLLGNLSDFYEKEVEVSVEKITSVITPVMIILIGVIVGFIVIALFLPIFNISSMMG